MAAGQWLPKAEAIPHLDPFHVNRAVLSCFHDSKMGWHVLDALWDGGKEEAACLMEAAFELGEAQRKRAATVVGNLRGNMDAIDIEPVPRHDGIREPVPLRRAYGLVSVCVVGTESLGHGAHQEQVAAPIGPCPR